MDRERRLSRINVLKCIVNEGYESIRFYSYSVGQEYTIRKVSYNSEGVHVAEIVFANSCGQTKGVVLSKLLRDREVI